MPTEAENLEIKETNDEIISVTGDTEKERIGIDEDLLEVETFTQEEVNTYLSVYEGQFIWLNFFFLTLLIWNWRMITCDKLLSLISKLVCL